MNSTDAKASANVILLREQVTGHLMIGGDLYKPGLFLLAYGSNLAEAAGVEAAAGRGIDGAGHHKAQRSLYLILLNMP